MKKTNTIAGLIISIICGAVFLALSYSEMGLSVKLLALLCVLVALSAFVQVKNANRFDTAKDYIKDVFGVKKPSKKRVNQYDWLRVLAVVLVCVIHIIDVDLVSGYLTGETEIIVFDMFFIVAMMCNPIYIMLSGGLLMEYREESVGHFYVNRIFRVVLPMLAYYCIYMKLMGEPINLEFIWARLKDLYCANTLTAPHYWLIYMIIAMYISVPFLRYMLKDMPYKTITWFVVLTLVFCGLDLYLPLNCGFAPVLISWTAVGVIGYWITREESRKYDWLLIGLGLVSLVISYFILVGGLDVRKYCCNLAPTMTLMAMGAFAVTYKAKGIFSKMNPVIATLSKYSYGMILIHWIVLHSYVRGIWDNHITDNHYMGFVKEIFLTIIVSYIVAFVFDNVVIVLIKALEDKIEKN